MQSKERNDSMETQKVCCFELEGSYEEIGKQIAKQADKTSFLCRRLIFLQRKMGKMP
jgi:hypothetical protein